MTLILVSIPSALRMEAKLKWCYQKPEGDGSWINGGYFVLHPNALEFINGDQSSWEAESLVRLAQINELHAYKHYGFWQPMDTIRDRQKLEELWDSGAAPWKTWSS